METDDFAEMQRNIITAHRIEKPDISVYALILETEAHTRLLITFYHRHHHDLSLALEAIILGVERNAEG